MRAILSLVAALYLAACAAETPPQIDIASGFSAEERGAIYDGWGAWVAVSAAMPAHVTFRASDDLGRLTAGEEGGGVIYLAHIEDPDLRREAILHELGHAIGLEHTKAPGIMFPILGGPHELQPSDIAECQRVGACPPSADPEAHT